MVALPTTQHNDPFECQEALHMLTRVSGHLPRVFKCRTRTPTFWFFLFSQVTNCLSANFIITKKKKTHYEKPQKPFELRFNFFLLKAFWSFHYAFYFFYFIYLVKYQIAPQLTL